MISNAVVLLSGGLDSTAAMCWALQRYNDVRAIGIDYGQQNRDAELTAGRGAADELGVKYEGICIADALLPKNPAGILGGQTSGLLGGLARAFVPGRNILFATIAAAHACTWWPDAFDIVLGACAEDQATFPDCKPGTMAQLGLTLQLGCARSIMIKTPWADRTKFEILYALLPDQRAFDIVRKSWSCYERTGPCGKCSACTNRNAAFERLGLEDLSVPSQMFGGDPQREAG